VTALVAGAAVTVGGQRVHGSLVGGRRATVVATDTIASPSGQSVEIVLVEFPRGKRRWLFASELTAHAVPA